MHKGRVKSILNQQNGFNLYRGCEHGCIYCDSRSKCYNMDHDFEDILVKENALELLENELKKKEKNHAFYGFYVGSIYAMRSTIGNDEKNA